MVTSGYSLINPITDTVAVEHCQTGKKICLCGKVSQNNSTLPKIIFLVFLYVSTLITKTLSYVSRLNVVIDIRNESRHEKTVAESISTLAAIVT